MTFDKMEIAPDKIPFEDSPQKVRAVNEGTIIRPRGRFTFVVRFCASDDGHEVRLSREITDDGEDYYGSCSCKGYRYNDGACSHLWAARLAEEWNVIQIPITSDVFETADECPVCGSTVQSRGEK